MRTKTGKGASRQARREGLVPVVLYGHGSDPQHLELNARDFAAVLRHSGTNAVLTLDIDGKEQLALTKAIAVHPVRRNIQHADLIVVRRGEKVTVEVNVRPRGRRRVGHPGHPGGQQPSRSRPTRCRSRSSWPCRSRASKRAPRSLPARSSCPRASP